MREVRAAYYASSPSGSFCQSRAIGNAFDCERRSWRAEHLLGRWAANAHAPLQQSPEPARSAQSYLSLSPENAAAGAAPQRNAVADPFADFLVKAAFELASAAEARKCFLFARNGEGLVGRRASSAFANGIRSASSIELPANSRRRAQHCLREAFAKLARVGKARGEEDGRAKEAEGLSLGSPAHYREETWRWPEQPNAGDGGARDRA